MAPLPLQLSRQLLALGQRGKAYTTPRKIRRTRQRAGLTQFQAAQLMSTSLRSWQQWELGERTMKGRDWELFCLLIGSPAARLALLRLDIQRH